MRSRYLDGREIAAVRARMSARDWLPFAVALDTGLRVGDVAKIRWDDIHGREIRFIAEKTGKAGRAALSAETAAALRRFRAVAGSAWVFPSPRDPQTHITRQALWKRLKAACRRAGVAVAGFSPHSFRKVYGVREYHAHGLGAAQAGLQHSDIATTEIYALADWLTEENADKPLLRSDMARIVRYIADWLRIDPREPRDPSEVALSRRK